MAYEDRKVICRTIEDVLVKLEDSILYRLLKIFFCGKIDILMITCVGGLKRLCKLVVRISMDKLLVPKYLGILKIVSLY